MDAVAQTRSDLQNLIDRVPDKIKNDTRWQEQVKPHLDQANEQMNVEKTQQLIKEIKSLLAVRQDVDQRLQGLSPEQRDAITWTKRGLQGLGSAATESHQRVFIDPAKGAVDSCLPEQQAQQVKHLLDQHQKDVEELARGTADLPVKGVENVFEASQRNQLDDPIVREDAAGVWEPREVDTPDFGRGWRKVEGWYKDSKEYLSQYIWQLRDVPELPDD